MIIFRVYFTDAGIPTTGLSPTIRVRKVSDASLAVADDPMFEIGDGWYKYDFTQYTGSVGYAVRADGGPALTSYERYATLGNENFVTDRFAADLFALNVSGSMNNAMQLIRNTENGGWKILNNQLIIFREDNLAEVARFNLFDASGSPTSKTNPSERTRV